LEIKLKKVYFSSITNVGRSFINPVLIMAVSYLFIRTNAKQELLEINKMNAIINAFIIFCGWGLKDYLLKENFKSMAGFSQKWNEALYSKLPLIFISLVIALFLPLEYSFIICGFIILRTINALYDSLIIYKKKVSLYFLLDAVIALLIVSLIWFNILTDHKLYFYILLGGEFLKLCLSFLLFRMIEPTYFSIIQAFNFLAATKLFFLLSLVSFFQSRADLYILGFLFDPAGFNEYQVKISLISFSQLAIASFVSVYSKLFFKDIFSSEAIFKNIIIKCGLIISILSAPIIVLIENYFFSFDFSIINNLVIIANIFIFSLVLIEMYNYTKSNNVGTIIIMLVISAGINLVLSFLLIKNYTITGGLLSNTISSLFLYVLLAARRKQVQNKNA